MTGQPGFDIGVHWHGALISGVLSEEPAPVDLKACIRDIRMSAITFRRKTGKIGEQA